MTEELEARIAELEAALKPFADEYCEFKPLCSLNTKAGFCLRVADFRHAYRTFWKLDK
jgi:hypothetical protein